MDFSSLEKLIANNDLTKMPAETQKVAKAISAIRAEEKALSNLIPDAHEWHKTYSLSELKIAHGKIQSTLDYWKAKGYDLATDSNLGTLKTELEQKIKFVENPGAFKTGLTPHKTWKVQQDAYTNLLGKVEARIEAKAIEADYNALLGFKTASKEFKYYMAKAKAAIDAGDQKTAKNYLASAQWKKDSLDAKRKGKAAGTSLKTLYSGGNPFTPAEIAKIKDYESKIIDGIMNGSGADDLLIKKYHNYVLKLSEKYYDKQVSIFSDTEREALRKSTDRYLARPAKNPHYIWGADLGGVYSGRDDKVKKYFQKLNGLTKEQISIVKRFTNGSTFSNAYNLRHSSPYWAKEWGKKMASLTPSEIKEMEKIIEEWSQGANYTLDKMVRYNGITFRGLDSGGGPELRANLAKAYKSGKPWVNEASCSTSMKHEVAQRFDNDTILIIHNKTGAYIHAISDYENEFEIMTLRGTKYKVLAPPKRVRV